VEAASHRALGHAAANGPDDAAALGGGGFFSAMEKAPSYRYALPGKWPDTLLQDKSLSFPAYEACDERKRKEARATRPTPLSRHTPRLGARVALQQSPILRTAETSLADRRAPRQLASQVTSFDCHLSDLF
jgi:hypothetical protein